MATKKKKAPPGTIAENRRARHEYHLEEFLEAGIVLQGWEVKALRAGKGSIADAYVILRRGEAFLLGANIHPLLSASTHVKASPERTRKLLLHKEELKKLIGFTQRKGYTLVATRLYWKNGKVKLGFALAKGKKQHDKRQAIKDRDFQREQARLTRK